MVAGGSFSAALILLSPSAITFSSDFAAKCFFVRVNQVHSNMCIIDPQQCAIGTTGGFDAASNYKASLSSKFCILCLFG